MTFERANEYGAWLDDDASWLGSETGSGNQWTGQPPGSKTQRFGEVLRITVKNDEGDTIAKDYAITANC